MSVQKLTYEDVYLNLPYSEHFGVGETRELREEIKRWDQLPNDYPGKRTIFLLLKYAAFATSGTSGKTNREVQVPEVPHVSGDSGHER